MNRVSRAHGRSKPEHDTVELLSLVHLKFKNSSQSHDKLDIMIIHHCMKFDKNIQIRYMYFLWDGAIITHDF